jgi:hypothetical protein
MVTSAAPSPTRLSSVATRDWADRVARRNPDAPPPQVRPIAIVRHRAGGSAHRDLRRTALQYERLQALPTSLLANGVPEAATRHMGPTGCDQLQRSHFVGTVDHADVQAFGPEIPQLHRQAQRKPGHRRASANRDDHRPVLAPDLRLNGLACHDRSDQAGDRRQRTSSNRIGIRHDGSSPVIVVLMTSVTNAPTSRIGEHPERVFTEDLFGAGQAAQR